MTYQQIKVETNELPFLCVILPRKCIPYIIFLMQGHLQCQAVKF